MKSVKNVLFMAMMAVVSFCATSCGSDSDTLDAYIKVQTAEGFKSRIEGQTNPQIVDYRSAEEYAAGHIPGAINFPATDKTAESAFKSNMNTLDQSKAVFLYGSKKSNSTMGFYLAGIVSSMGWGQSRTVHLTNGYESWVEAGYSVEK